MPPGESAQYLGTSMGQRHPAQRFGQIATLLSLLAIAACCAYLAVGLIWSVVSTGARANDYGDAPSLLNLGVVLAFLAAVTRRLVLRDITPPASVLAFSASVLRTFAVGWLLGLTLLTGRELWHDLLVFGAPPDNGSYAADAAFFVLATLVIALPGLGALLFARAALARSSHGKPPSFPSQRGH